MSVYVLPNPYKRFPKLRYVIALRKYFCKHSNKYSSVKLW